ncbi:unnamed protein product [Sphagnum balticum]
MSLRRSRRSEDEEKIFCQVADCRGGWQNCSLLLLFIWELGEEVVVVEVVVARAAESIDRLKTFSPEIFGSY